MIIEENNTLITYCCVIRCFTLKESHLKADIIRKHEFYNDKKLQNQPQIICLWRSRPQQIDFFYINIISEDFVRLKLPQIYY
jgi:hypothetical protein